MRLTKVWEQIKASNDMDSFIKDLECEIQAEADMVNLDINTPDTKSRIKSHILKLNIALEVLKDADNDSSYNLLKGIQEEDTGLIGKLLASYMLEVDENEKNKVARTMMWLLNEYAETNFLLNANRKMMEVMHYTVSNDRRDRGDEQC